MILHGTVLCGCMAYEGQGHQMEILPLKPSGSSQTLTKMHLLPLLLHFSEFAHFNSEKEAMIDG